MFNLLAQTFVEVVKNSTIAAGRGRFVSSLQFSAGSFLKKTAHCRLRTAGFIRLKIYQLCLKLRYPMS